MPTTEASADIDDDSDDPGSLVWCAGLLALGGLLFLAELQFGNRHKQGA